MAIHYSGTFEELHQIVGQLDVLVDKAFDERGLKYSVSQVLAVLADEEELLSPGDRAIVGTKWRDQRVTAAVLVAQFRDQCRSGAVAVEASARIREIQQAQRNNLAVVDLDAPRGVPPELWTTMLREGCGITDVAVS